MNAVITAGGPIDGDYARAAGTTLKALAPIGDRTMLARTIDALRAARVERIAVVGDERIARACGSLVERVIADRGSGSGNVLAALDAWSDDDAPLLYLTCDMPFVTGPALRAFVDAIRPEELAMPLTEHADFVARFPGAPPFGITLGGECVVNGGAFHIPAGAATRIRSFATTLFDARKSPWKMATVAGLPLLLKFAIRRLTIGDLERRARTVLGIPARALRNAPAELAFDADTIDEYRYAIARA